ncbi:DUF3040 domain-containing protein [Amycolatopsis anabasis]|uniref:DUF3040 domain-containing protein n=1 Tax=Amycolatopsis anabasis TaxID=1840409 RepID=UPI00131B77CC|nr:DUF3040 domain-containing protein [Amycolatopsis anabasis]
MALHDEEQRRLAEIELRLAEENPRLAQRLAELRPIRISGTILAVVAVVGALTIGLTMMTFGAQSSSLILMVLGALLAVVVPTAAVWRCWLHRLH